MPEDILHIELPLLGFFQELQERSQGFHLGTGAYFLMQEALKTGIGVASKEDLFSLCKVLWMKPYYHKEEWFRQLFDKHLRELLISESGEPEPEKEPEQKASFSRKSDEKDAQLPEEESSEKSGEAEEEPDTETKGETDNEPTLVFEDSADLQATINKTDAEVRQIVFATDFLIEGDYYPLTGRRMKQNWRSLRQVKREGAKREFDLEGTIEETTEKGYLEELMYRSPRENKTLLISLFDNSPSMVAFFELGDQLVSTASRYNHIGTHEVYYFHNCPARFLYRDKEHDLEESLSEIEDKAHSSILIFSDAGAARGLVVPERVEATIRFLSKLKNHKVAWLNPMPRHRWANTSAEYIALYVNMFSTTAEEFSNAIKLLKSRFKGSLEESFG